MKTPVNESTLNRYCSYVHQVFYKRTENKVFISESLQTK